jgi:Anti-sigma factor NepR
MDHRKPTGPKGSMAAPMQVASTEKRRTSLNREIQLKIGQQLRASYNEVVDQGVPSRFAELISRLDVGVVKPEPRPEQDDKEAQK